jgi:FtsP/CotA-like multicopper oxidase with cupredoxin domain
VRERRRAAASWRGIVVGISVVVLVATGCSSSGSSAKKHRETATEKFAKGLQRHAPFADPPEISAKDGVLHTTLTPKAEGLQLGGKTVGGRAYNDEYVGPTLRLHHGDRLEVETDNQLAQTTNLHTHGFFVSPAGNSDNVFVSINAGQTFENQYTINDGVNPGTYWYHAHLHHHAESQVFGGMSGIIIVDGLQDLMPAELRNVPDHVFALKDFQVDKHGNIPANNIDSDAPTIRTVNGLVDPTITLRPGETQLWRLANIGADIWYRLKLDGHRFTVVGEDANPVDQVWTADELVLPPGKRYDVLVQASDTPGTYALQTLQYSTGPAGDTYPTTELTQMVVKGDPVKKLAMPTTMMPLDDLGKDPIAMRRSFVFSENTNTNQFYINGKQFDPNRVDAAVTLGTTEEWTVSNVSQEQHPFHIHVNDIQVMSVNGQPYDARSWQDTVILPVGGTVVMRMRFRTFTGMYVFHCHILNHEDNGMMGVVNVS